MYQEIMQEALDDMQHGVEAGNITFQMLEDEHVIAAIMVALKKQIPKKLISKEVSEDIKVNSMTLEKETKTYYCPTCEKLVLEEDKFCRDCGQGLSMN